MSRRVTLRARMITREGAISNRSSAGDRMCPTVRLYESPLQSALAMTTDVST